MRAILRPLIESPMDRQTSDGPPLASRGACHFDGARSDHSAYALGPFRVSNGGPRCWPPARATLGCRSALDRHHRHRRGGGLGSRSVLGCRTAGESLHVESLPS